MSHRIRPCVFAGPWYPGDARELERTIDQFFANVESVGPHGEVVGLISPHAGYIFSGQVAAYAYDQVRGKPFDVVVVVSPVHSMYAGPYATTAADAYRTPLGDVFLDSELVDAVDKRLGLNRLPVDREHSLEIQLPFLQVSLGTFSLLPIMLVDQEWRACSQLANALGDVLKQSISRGKNALLVASTDLSHYHHASQAERLDRIFAKHIDAFDPEGLFRALVRGETEACGGGPAIAVMLAAKALGANQAKTLYYAHSGHVTGDYSSVVGYTAGAIYRAPEGAPGQDDV